MEFLGLNLPLANYFSAMKQSPQALAIRSFRNVTRSWFVVTYLGQLVFAYYIIMLYWKSAAQGNFDKWNTANPDFYVKGDGMGNLVFGMHVAFAAIVMILGPLQLIPALRKKMPRLHRISGRIYITAAFIIGTGGLYLTWVRGAIGGPVAQVTISFNALIILVSAFFSIRYAIQRKINLHNQWAVHLLLAMSGVWFFRVFLMLWLVIFKRPVGFDPETFTGPFLTCLGIFVYIFPQAVAALYFKAKFSGERSKKWAFTTFLLITTLAMAVGIFGAIAGMWLPRI